MRIGPLIPFVCSYLAGDGNRYGLTMWATSPEQLELEWVDKIIGFRVDGILIEEEPY